jgi:hypothetical protein
MRLLLVLRLARGVGFRLLVLLLLSFDFSVHTGNTSFNLIDTIRRAKDTIIFICLIDFFYLKLKTVCPGTRKRNCSACSAIVESESYRTLPRDAVGGMYQLN